MYLFEGKDWAILFDTGMWRGDLAAYPNKSTKLPIDVVISHGNRDHFLQVDQFPNFMIYMSELDVTRLPPELVTLKYKWIKGGDVIDIGAGRKFQIRDRRYIGKGDGPDLYGCHHKVRNNHVLVQLRVSTCVDPGCTIGDTQLLSF